MVEEITNKYGEEAVNNLIAFDYETINSQTNYGETVNLGDSGYTATKDENGNIIVKDAAGNLVYNWETKEEVKGESQDVIDDVNTSIIEQDQDTPQFSEI